MSSRICRWASRLASWLRFILSSLKIAKRARDRSIDDAEPTTESDACVRHASRGAGGAPSLARIRSTLAMTKAILSLLAEYGPLFVVYFWMQRRFPGRGRRFLFYAGPGFIASGICMYIGTKYSGFVLYGRGKYLSGESAVGGSTLFVAMGIVFLALYPLLTWLFPKWMSSNGNGKRG